MRDFITFNLIVVAAVLSAIPFVGNSIAAAICNIAGDISQDCTHKFTRKDFK